MTDPTNQPEAQADTKGHAVYDLTIQQYVGSVTRDKPSQAEARKLVAKGHEFEVRPV